MHIFGKLSTARKKNNALAGSSRLLFLFVNMNIALGKGDGDVVGIERFFDLFGCLEEDVPDIC